MESEERTEPEGEKKRVLAAPWVAGDRYPMTGTGNRSCEGPCDQWQAQMGTVHRQGRQPVWQNRWHPGDQSLSGKGRAEKRTWKLALWKLNQLTTNADELQVFATGLLLMDNQQFFHPGQANHLIKAFTSAHSSPVLISSRAQSVMTGKQ